MADPRMAEHQHRLQQLEGLRNVPTNDEFNMYEKLAAGRLATVDPENGNPQIHYIPVPVTLKSQMGSPTTVAVGGFATTLTTLSCALMGFRGLSVTDVFVADFLAIAAVGMGISAILELFLGNTYAYTTLFSFSLFYGGFGLLNLPVLGVADAYGGADSPGYSLAVGFFVLLWSAYNVPFLLGSLPLNLAYIWIFFFVQLAFTLVAAGYLVKAEGHMELATRILTAGGACAFLSGLGGYYVVFSLMIADGFGFVLPLGDTSRYFKHKKSS